MAPICFSKNVTKKWGEKLGVHPSKVETLLKAWTNERIKEGKKYDLSDKTASASAEQYINNKLCRTKQYFSEQEDFDAAHKFWEEATARIKELGDLSEKQIKVILKDVGEVFDPSTFVVYTTNDNVKTISIKEPELGEETSTEEIEVEESERDSNFDVAKKIVSRLRKDAKKVRKIEKDENGEDVHYYEVKVGNNWQRVDTSVTQLVNGDTAIKPEWKIPSTTLGNTADLAVRKFFNGETIDALPNMGRADLEALKEDLLKLKNYFDETFGKDEWVAVTDELPMVSQYAVKEGNKTVYKTIAGTMDMLLYTKSGDFYIYDVKTKRVNSSSEMSDAKLSKYSGQVSLYKSMLEANYPEIRGRIKGMGLIQFDVQYPDATRDTTINYTSEDGVLYINGAPIANDSRYSSPRLHSTGEQTLEAIIPVDFKKTVDKIESIKKETKDSNEPLLNTKALKQAQRDRQLQEEQTANKERSARKKAWRESKLLTPSQKLYLSNLAMNLASDLITELNTDERANEKYFPDGEYASIDFTKLKRDEVIQTLTVKKLFDAVRDRYFDPDRAAMRGVEDEVLEGLDVAYDNFDAIIEDGYAKFILLENYSIVRLNQKEFVTTEGYDEQMSAEQEQLEEKEREYYQLGFRQISAKAGLSTEIRRFFEKLRLPEDDTTFRLPRFLDSNMAINSILDWCKDCETMEDMEQVLKDMSEIDANAWVKIVLDKIQDEPFRSKFYNNFRKDFSQYSITYPDYDRKGKMVLKTKIINTKSAVQTLLDGLVASFKEGRVSSLIHTNDTLEGRGYVIAEKLKTIKENKEALDKRLKDTFNTEDKKQYAKIVREEAKSLSSLLSSLGMQVKADVLTNILLRDGMRRNWDTTSAYKILQNIKYIIEDLEKHTGRAEMYSPVLDNDDSEDEGGVFNNYKSIAQIISPALQDGIEACTYQNGKMYYSFTVPSYLQGLVKNLQNANGRIEDFIRENYKYDTFFYIDKNGKKTSLCDWLNKLETSSAARNTIAHKVQLSFDGTEYKELSELGYTLSLMAEFFYDKNKKLAWYRVPVLSNKPSSEFIRFYRYAGTRYQDELTRKFEDVCLQEIIRIQSVLQAAANNLDEDLTQPIENYNISKEDLQEFRPILEKVRDKKPLTHSDLVKNGQWILSSKHPNGASFKFLSDLNQHLINNTRLGQLILDKINDGISSKKTSVAIEPEFSKEFKAAWSEIMSDREDSEVKQWRDLGLFDTIEKEVEREVEQNGKKVKRKYTQVKYKYLDYLHKLTWEQAYDEAAKKLGENSTEENIVEAAKELIEEEITDNLRNYIWNDAFATIEIIQLSAVDVAYYKNMEDFQKRIAQLHSPTMKLNKQAVMSNGRKWSKDGKCRTILIKDSIITSELIPNIKAILDAKINAATSTEEMTALRKLRNEIIKAYEEINTTDGQAYDSITSYMKKLAMVGKWDSTMMEAYNRIVKGNWNVDDLDILWTPFKPFVYTQLKKTTGTETRPEQKVPMQIKNSEYLLLLGDALLRSTKNKTTLNALFDFMESTAYDSETHNLSTYNGIGIDCVAFGSNVKSGLKGEIDIFKYGKKYNDVIRALNEAVYYNEDHTGSEDNNGDRYDDQFVHTFDFNDYGFQQEVPAHLVDHEQLMGSQSRILSMSDFTPTQLAQQLGNLGITVEEGIEEYQKLIAENIRDSYKQLIKDFKLKGSPREKREALADILYETIVKDQRYGGDLLYACQLNEEGEFNIPLNDPIQAVRIQQLLNSIIKSRINKQTISGGPVVQTTSFGLDKRLSVIFKDHEGNKLKTYSEFCKENRLDTHKESSKELFHKYVSDNQGSLSHFEIMMPVPSSEMRKALTRKDGSLMTPKEAIAAGIITEDALKAICYRIPTEDKYSIIPCEIVGFLPSAEEAIMMPEEITVLTGSDFDIDKMYVMLKTFMATKNGFKLSTDARDKRNNRIFDILYNLLTHGATMEKMFNPQSFDPQKRAARIVTLLENGYKYGDIKDKSLKELTKLAEEVAPSHNIVFSSSQVYFHRQNMTAGKLIGIFANNNTSHAFLSMQDIRLNLPRSSEFTFNGVAIDDNTKLDDILAKDGFTLISKNIAGFLAASVDAVKVPVLNLINLNTATAGPAMVLARLGFDPESIALFLSQPLIKEVVRTYFKMNNEGYIALDDLIEQTLTEDRFKFVDVDVLDKDLKNSEFTKEELAEEIGLQDPESENQIRALLLLKRLTGMARDLNTLTFMTKFNSVSNSPGPMISDAIVMQDRLRRFESSMVSSRGNLLPTAPFKESALYVIKNSPILSAFYDTTLGNEGAVKLLFQDYFPHFSVAFESCLETLRTFTKSTLDSAAIDRFVNFFTLYKLTFTDFLIGGKEIEDGGVTRPMTAEEARQWYIKEFPAYYGKKKEELNLSENALIDIISYEGKTKRCPIPTLKAKTGSYSIDMQEKVKAAWTELMQSDDERVRELGRDLFIYNIYRNGFTFSPKTFLNLASTDVKLSPEIRDGYTEFMRDPENGNSDVDPFNLIVQFCRNFSHSRKLVPELPPSKRLQIKSTKNAFGETTLTITKKKEDDKFAFDGITTLKQASTFFVAPVIIYEGNVYVRYDNSPIANATTTLAYKLSTPLGIQNEFLEVDGSNDDGGSMESVIDQKSAPRKAVKKESPSIPTNTSDEEMEEQNETKSVSITQEDQMFLGKLLVQRASLYNKFVAAQDNSEGFSKGQLEVLKELKALLGPQNAAKIQEIIDKIC